MALDVRFNVGVQNKDGCAAKTRYRSSGETACGSKPDLWQYPHLPVLKRHLPLIQPEVGRLEGTPQVCVVPMLRHDPAMLDDSHCKLGPPCARIRLRGPARGCLGLTVPAARMDRDDL
jgi:hypothetical protein